MSQIDNFEAMLARGQDSEMLRYTLGNAYMDEGEHSKAILHLQKAVELKPTYSAAWRQLGRALAANKQLREAKVVFDQGEIVAEANGDKQAGKEINVFRKRVIKALANE
jgi:predicted Zn-dependent protease